MPDAELSAVFGCVSCHAVSTLLPLTATSGKNCDRLVVVLTTKSSPNGLPNGSNRRSCVDHSLVSGAVPRISNQVTIKPPSAVPATCGDLVSAAEVTSTLTSGVNEFVNGLNISAKMWVRSV